MQYLLMVYNSEKAWEDMTDAQRDAGTQAYGALTEELRASKHLISGEALREAATATTVRVRDGKTQTTDGPFAEAREMLGGYFLIEAQDLDEATRIAARIPDAAIGNGGVEIRPIMTFG